MSNEQPRSLDEIAGLSRPQQGDPPAELDDPGNFLVFDRLSSATSSDAADEVTSSVAQRDDGRLRVCNLNTVLGVVVEPAEPTTPDVVESELADILSTNDSTARDTDAYIPDWTAVSVLPTMGTARKSHTLLRRNGTRVRPEGVIRPDGRSPYYPNTYPLTLVGRLLIWRNASAPDWSDWGTASLLGARTIMTASHVVPWGASNWKALFVPAYYNGTSLHGSWAASWVTNVRGYRDHDQGDDMAVMRLDVPLGNSLGFFGFRTYTDDWEDRSWWTLPGYPRDKDDGERPWLHADFPVIDDDNDGAGVELEYRADTNRGQSGSPVYGWFPRTARTVLGWEEDYIPCVIGTHVGTEDNVGEPTQNVAAGGKALTNLLRWARTNWP